MTKKTHTMVKLRASTLAIAAGFALSGAPLAACAAGLGKVTVFSALGQPLRAEVELTASREELSSMKAGLAPPAAFKDAGLDYVSALLSIRFTMDKRANGQPIIKLSSDRPINEPFVDMLLELNWASGRLVREYTFLLDPPEMAVKAPSPVAAPETRAQAPRAAPASTAMPRAVGESVAAPAARPSMKARAEAVGESKSESADTYTVKHGDTLRKIASANVREGVSLDQMLVGLFRANKDAFDGGNMNRMRSGKILTVPQQAEVEAVSPTEARKIVVAQAADWNAYRRKLAAAAEQAKAGEDAGKQEASGKITAKVEEKAAPESESKDKLQVSRTESGKGKPGAALSEDELVAKDKALKEATERLAVLEKNVNELQKLLEMKNQNLAELQKQAVKPAAADAAKPAPPPVEPVKPAAAAKPAEAPKPAEPAVPPVVAEPPKTEAAKPAEEPKSEEKADAAKAEAAKPAETVKPAAEAPKPKPKAVIPPPPPEEPSFFEELMDNPAMLAGGVGVLALLAGLVVYKRRRAAAGGETPLTTSTAGLSQTSLGENSVFRNTGGQSVDTSHTPPQTDFSQAGPGTIDTDEVDPVAEADVYMAYGRDVQAEEILLEAKSKDPKRYAIHLKLLEIYANRQNSKQFETLATELFTETGGVGADWEKAVAMGLKLDPQNPLYGNKRAEAVAGFDSDATVIVSPQKMKNTVTLPGELSQMAAEASAPQAAAPELPVAAAADEVASLDFDLGPSTTEAAVSANAAPAAAAEPEAETGTENPVLVTTLTLPEAALPPADESGALDFDIGNASSASPTETEDTVVGLDFEMPEIKPESAPADAGGLDFDLGFDTPAAPAEATPPKAPAVAPAEAAPAPAESGVVLDIGNVDADALEFDVKLTESTVLGQPMPSSFDMSAIDLDLEAPKAEPAPAPKAAPVEAGFETAQMETVVNPSLASVADDAGFEPIAASEEVATKLDLAKAYEEMGDLEGARELLGEVMNEGNADQKAAASAILERVGA